MKGLFQQNKDLKLENEVLREENTKAKKLIIKILKEIEGDFMERTV